MSRSPTLDSTPEPPPLSELEDVILDASGLADLFADLEAHATGVDIRWKGDPTGRAESASPSLAESEAALLAGAGSGVQIRYLYEGTGWWDTLLRVPEGVRVVRMKR